MFLRASRDAINIVAIVTLIFSISLLMVTLTLDDLHKWIRPIQQDALPYMVVLISGLLIALGLFMRNARFAGSWGEISHSNKLVPYVIMTASGIGFILLIFAGEVDKILASMGATLIPMLTVVAFLGMVLLIASNGSPRRKKDRYMG